jgi:DNA-binding NarL/FixJ family response regulator
MPVLKRATARVLLVDDHPVIRLGLTSLINEAPNLTVCGEAASSQQGLELIASLQPNLVVVDISLKDGDGIELIKDVRARYPQVRLVVLSMHDEEIDAERALRAGASGYVMKAEAAGTVMAAIHRVLSGKIYISEKATERLLRLAAVGRTDPSTPMSRFDQLSDRELQIYRLLGGGVRVRDIAAQLHVSAKTVESHRVNIKRKLGFKTSAELLRYAIQDTHLQR